MGEGENTTRDDVKNERNIVVHRIDFADLDDIFDRRFALVAEDGRRDYGERRFNMLVEVHGLVLNVTFTQRPPKRRIISARLANRKERGIFHGRQQN